MNREHEKTNESTNTNGVLFETYSNRFDSNDLLKIRSIGPGFKSDSTFISSIMSSLYKNDFEKLICHGEKI